MNKYFQNIILLLALILLMPFILIIYIFKLVVNGIAYIICTFLDSKKYNKKNEWKFLTKLCDVFGDIIQ